uniref:Uncharacterized protein n=1 Tax=viral metagenome TaxID=1070528 RepID=A0A6M3JM13_9ZZZZ
MKKYPNIIAKPMTEAELATMDSLVSKVSGQASRQYSRSKDPHNWNVLFVESMNEQAIKMGLRVDLSKYYPDDKGE